MANIEINDKERGVLRIGLKLHIAQVSKAQDNGIALGLPNVKQVEKYLVELKDLEAKLIGQAALVPNKSEDEDEE